MPNYVLDACVVIKWFKEKNEEKVEQARLLLDQLLQKKIKISVPTLLFYEIISIASYDKYIPKHTWEEIIETIFALPFEVYPVDKFLGKEIYFLAKELDISSYDAVYLALAKRLKAPLLTADCKLLDKGKGWVKSL